MWVDFIHYNLFAVFKIDGWFHVPQGFVQIHLDVGFIQAD